MKRFRFNNFQTYIFKITKNWQTERFCYVSFLLFLLALKNKSDTVFVTPNENSPISQHKLATQHIIVSLSALSFWQFRSDAAPHGKPWISRIVLNPATRYVIFKTQKENNRPQGGLTSMYDSEKSTPSLAKVPGWFFYALKHYLINVKTNVSNARMNMPKAIRSLKSKWLLFISTTPILCKNRGLPPCNTIVPPKV